MQTTFHIGPDKKYTFSFRDLRFDASLILLLAANVFAAVTAVRGGWDAGLILWTFWFQSVIIGIFATLKILTLRQFSTEGMRMNGHTLAPDASAKKKVALFFFFHYGFFHFIYALFLGGNFGTPDMTVLFPVVAAFLVNHAVSFVMTLVGEADQVKHLGTMMFTPYYRIIPMHLIIIVGSLFAGSVWYVILFFVLKTFADVLLHMMEHRNKDVLLAS